MQEQELKEFKKENSVEKEIRLQNDLHEAKDSFKEDEIVAMTILECAYEGSGKVKYNGEIYKLQRYTDSSYPGHGETVYVPVFVLDYNGVYKTFSKYVYTSKNNANNFIRELKNYEESFRFKIESESCILFSKSKNKFYEKLKGINYIDSYTNRDVHLLSIFLLGLSGAMFGLVMQGLEENGMATMQTALISGGLLISLGVSPIFIQKSINAVNSKFDTYNIIDINPQDIIEEDMLNKTSTEYTIVEADLDVGSDSLTVSSDELSCQWTYERKENELLDETGVELINSVPITDNSCVLAVKDSGYSDSPWVSDDGKWWIDIKQSMN